MSQRRSCDRELTVCSLFSLEPVASEELEEEAAHDHVCVLSLRTSFAVHAEFCTFCSLLRM